MSEKKKDTGLKDKRKQSLYLPVGLMEEVTAEARRQDRSISWLIQQSWKIARARIAEYPSAYGTDEKRSAHSEP